MEHPVSLVRRVTGWRLKWKELGKSSGCMGPWPGHCQVRKKMHSSHDWDSFEMWKMMVRTDQLLCIMDATSSKIHQWGSEAETDGRVKKLIQSLKQYHSRFNCFYEKGSKRAMIGLQGLYSNDTFWCLNIAASMGLKSFFPRSFKFGGNIETIATHLREMHYRLAIACNICQLFASMSVQVVLEHQSGCRTKSHKKSKAKKQDEAS